MVKKYRCWIQVSVVLLFCQILHGLDTNDTTTAGTDEVSTEPFNCPTDLPTPENITITSKNSTSFTIQWNPVEYNENYFYVVEVINVTEFQTDNVTAEINHVSPWTNYTVFVKVAIENSQKNCTGESNSITVETWPSEPSSPVNLTRLQLSNTSDIVLLWEPPLEPNGPLDGYEIKVFESEIPDRVVVFTTTGPLYHAKNLKFWTNYTFEVSAFNEGQNGEKLKGEKAILQEQTNCGVPSKPLNFTAQLEKATEISLTWERPKEPEGPIDGYVVQLMKVNESTGINGEISVTELFYSVQNLDYWQEYTFYVSAFNFDLEGKKILGPNAELSLKTGIGVPSKPVNLNASLFKENAVYLTWEPPIEPNGPIDGYTVQPLKSDQNIENIVANTTELSFTLENLEFWQDYNFYVAAFNKDENKGILFGEKEETSIKTGKGHPSQVRDFTATAISIHHIHLEWRPPEQPAGPIDGYLLSWRNVNDRSFYDVKINRTRTSWVMGRLQPFQRYLFKMAAFNRPRLSEAEDEELLLGDMVVVFESTPMGAPSEPLNFRVSYFNSTSVFLEWEPPEILNGELTKYVLKYNETDRENEPIKTELGDFASDHWLKGLTPWTSYVIWLYGVNMETINTSYVIHHRGKKVFVEIQMEMDKPSVPRECRIESSTSNSLNVCWSEPKHLNGPLDYYLFEWNRTAEFEPQSAIIYKNCENVTDLTPWTGYRFAVAGVNLWENSTLEGEFCWVEGKTEEALPSAPVGLRCTNASYTWIGLQWETPEKPNGHIIGYFVRVSNQSQELKTEHLNGTQLTFNVSNLEPGTNYTFKVRAKNGKGDGRWSESIDVTSLQEEIEVVEDNESADDISGVVGAVIGTLAVIILIIIASYLYRYKFRNRFNSKNTGTNSTSSTSTNVGENPKPLPNAPDFMLLKNISLTRPVKLVEFATRYSYLSCDTNLRFSQEYEDLVNSSPHLSADIAQTAENRPKNRWINILPFDHSRVKLLPIDDEPGSDYINASYITGYNSQREYIATQGPLPRTVDDFWRLIWEQNTSMIVMVTQCMEHGKIKCEKYWPTNNEPRHYGDLQICLTSESILSSYSIRVVSLTLGNRVKIVKQMHFTKWPDFGCPENPEILINFVRAVRDHLSGNDTGPIVVHCSAGVGRTGTFIALDRLMHQIHVHDCVDIFWTVLDMRQYRIKMVQTEDQYIYLYQCVLALIQEQEAIKKSSEGDGYEVYENYTFKADSSL